MTREQKLRKQAGEIYEEMVAGRSADGRQEPIIAALERAIRTGETNQTTQPQSEPVAEPLPPQPAPKKSLRKIVWRRIPGSFEVRLDEDDPARPMATFTNNAIIGCDQCRTTARFEVLGVAFSDQADEVVIYTRFPPDWVRDGTNDYCPLHADPKERQERR